MKIYSQAPCRISLFGGGTDLDPYASKYGGLCINLAVNIRSKFTLFTSNDIYDPLANSNIPYLGTKKFVHTILEEFGIGDMHLARFNSEFDGILESGIGSSASAAVAILGAINKYQNLKMNQSIIAERAWQIEVNTLNLFGGKQDQYAAVFGGMNVMFFTKDGVKIIPFDKQIVEPILSSLVLFYTGFNRKSAKIQEGFKKLNKDQIWALNYIKRIATLAFEPIEKGDFRKVGALLDEAWEYKKLSNKGITNKRIDEIYKYAKDYGAYGGKILGAGGGGYMLFVVNPEERQQFINYMAEIELEWEDFSPCWNGLEVRVLPSRH